MPRITVPEAQSWAEPTKLTLGSLDAQLETQLGNQVVARLRSRFEEADTWVDDLTTPTLVKSIIAMTYVSWFYSRQFSEDEAGSNQYALRLLQVANELTQGLLDGSVLLEDEITPPPDTGPSFYPTDESSLLEPTPEDSSLGPEKFSMGQIW